MSALHDHERAINARQRVERSMGIRWHDVLSETINRDVLSAVVQEEKLYRQRLQELQRVNNQAKTRLDSIKNSR